jgi:hypothetical protein
MATIMVDGNIIISNVECELLHVMNVTMATIMVDGNIITRCGTFPKGKLVFGKVSPKVHYTCEATLIPITQPKSKGRCQNIPFQAKNCWHMEYLECMKTHI